MVPFTLVVVILHQQHGERLPIWVYSASWSSQSREISQANSHLIFLRGRNWWLFRAGLVAKFIAVWCWWLVFIGLLYCIKRHIHERLVKAETMNLLSELHLDVSSDQYKLLPLRDDLALVHGLRYALFIKQNESYVYSIREISMLIPQSSTLLVGKYYVTMTKTRC